MIAVENRKFFPSRVLGGVGALAIGVLLGIGYRWMGSKN